MAECMLSSLSLSKSEKRKTSSPFYTSRDSASRSFKRIVGSNFKDFFREEDDLTTRSGEESLAIIGTACEIAAELFVSSVPREARLFFFFFGMVIVLSKWTDFPIEKTKKIRGVQSSRSIDRELLKTVKSKESIFWKYKKYPAKSNGRGGPTYWWLRDPTWSESKKHPQRFAFFTPLPHYPFRNCGNPFHSIAGKKRHNLDIAKKSDTLLG